MSEIAQEAQQEFWRSPAMVEPAADVALPAATAETAEACADCGTEFMISARFCHTCGLRRPVMATTSMDAAVIAGLWARNSAWVRSCSGAVAASWRNISLPGWMQYLHFHRIKGWIGLPTVS